MACFSAFFRRGRHLQESGRKREDDWFRQNEKKLLEAAREARLKRERERAAHEREQERERLRELHFMKCPKCGHDMRGLDIQGLEIDRCTFCEGLFLDAGELEELFLKKQVEERRGIFRKLLGL